MTFILDAQGSIIALTDNTGAIQTRYSYGPFGNVTITGAASDNPYQFAGIQNTGAGVYFGSSGYYNPASGLGIGGGTVSGVGNFANLSAPSSANATPTENGSCNKCFAELDYKTVDYIPFPNNWH